MVTLLFIRDRGEDKSTKEQNETQQLTRGNLGPAICSQQGFSVRVVRGAGHNSPRSPSSGYEYAGIYRVERFWHEPGLSGHPVYRYRLVRTA